MINYIQHPFFTFFTVFIDLMHCQALQLMNVIHTKSVIAS